MNQLLSSASKAFMIWPLALSHLLSPSLGLPTSSHLAFFYFLNTSNSFPLQGLCTYFSLCLELTPGFSYDSLLFTSQISSKISPPQEALPDNPHSKFPFPLCHFPAHCLVFFLLSTYHHLPCYRFYLSGWGLDCVYCS